MRWIAVALLFLCCWFSLRLPMTAAVSETVTAPSNVECVCGPKRVNILLFDFEDVKHNASSTLEKYQQIFREMNASFYRQSYGQMWLVEGNVYGWFTALTLHRPISLRGLNVTATPVSDTDASELEDAATSTAFFNLHIAPTDDSEWPYNESYLFAVFAGDVYAWAMMGSSRVHMSSQAYRLAIIGESWGVTTFMHEFAHVMGLDDVPESTMGPWDLMGPGFGDRLCVWSRLQLGWLRDRDLVSPNTTATASVLILGSSDDPSGIRAMKIQVPKSQYGEQIETTDSVLPKVWAETTEVWAEAQNGKVAVYMYQNVYTKDIYCGHWGCDFGISSRPDLRLLSELSDENTSAGRVFVSQEMKLAVILLEMTTDGVKIKVTNRVEGAKAEQSLIALEQARRSYESAASFRGDVLDPNWNQTMSRAKEALVSAWESFRKGDFDSAIASAMKSQENARNAEELVRKAQEEQARLQTATMWLAVACCLVLVVVIGYVRWHRKPRPKQEKMDRYTA